MSLDALLLRFEAPIEDADEETFLLFSQSLPNARDLGFVDSKASSVTVPLGDDQDEVTLVQSPSLLTSSISTGTTGAVLWRVSPLVANWLRRPDNPLFLHGGVGQRSTALELGCGVAGITALAAATRVGQYICTDQQYVHKLLRQNIVANLSNSANGQRSEHRGSRTARKPRSKPSSKADGEEELTSLSNIRIIALDWETSVISSLVDEVQGLADTLDLVLACDCIYNSHLVQPFVQTCAELCRLKDGGNILRPPVLCIVAQQLRSEDVFCEWLCAFMKEFKVWRIPESMLLAEMRPDQGFVLHLGILRAHMDTDIVT